MVCNSLRLIEQLKHSSKSLNRKDHKGVFMLRRHLSGFAILATVTGALVGCNSQTNVNNAAGTSQKEPAWKLTLKSECSQTADSLCLARYGFTVTADGQAILGPDAQGHVKTDQLTKDEMAHLNADLNLAFNVTDVLDRVRTEVCASTAPQNEKQSLEIVRHQKSKTLVRASGTDLCSEAMSTDAALTLLTDMQQLATTYYKLPFPDTCQDSARAFEANFEGLRQGCHSNDDCTYVDSAFNPILIEAPQFIVTDTCKEVAPLVVANTQSLLGHRQFLQTAYSQIEEACGPRMIRSNCTSVNGISVNGSPVCQRGVCRAKAE